MDFHAWFHRTAPRTCGFQPIESTARIWFDSETDPRQLLMVWATTYADAFVRHHPPAPAWRGARLLRERVARPADIQGVARAIGASRSALDASFRRTFAMTPSAYHRRVRLVHGLTELRNGGTKVEGAARLAGFASVKNFNRAVRQHTAMTLSQVRQLPRAEFERLLQSHLQIDPAVLAEKIGVRRTPNAERRTPNAERRTPGQGLSPTDPMSIGVLGSSVSGHATRRSRASPAGPRGDA